MRDGYCPYCDGWGRVGPDEQPTPLDATPDQIAGYDMTCPRCGGSGFEDPPK